MIASLSDSLVVFVLTLSHDGIKTKAFEARPFFVSHFERGQGRLCA